LPIDSTACGQADILLKLPRRSGPPLAPGTTSAPSSSLTKTVRCSRRTRIMASGMPTTRRPALTQHLRSSRVSFQQHERNLACGVPLVHVVSTPRAGVHDRSETDVVAVDARPQPFALLS
jgi:hypothetical protein